MITVGDDAPDIPTRHELLAPHTKALAALSSLLDDPERFFVWYTSRRAAKTSTLARAHLLTALTIPGANCIYTALTRGQAREVVFRTIWQPMLAKYEIAHKTNLTHQQTIFPNGSSVLFGGLDDEKHVLTNLGTRLDLFTPDECQAAPSSLLKRLIEIIIAPAASDRAAGKILMAGTIPETQGGYFYEAITNGRWKTFNWSRWDNPFLEDHEKALAEHLALTGLDVSDPIIRREWRGELVFDSRATAYRYNRDRNGYTGDPPRGLDRFGIGIDPGTRDRTAIIVWGWNNRDRRVWHVDEWVTERHAETQLSQIADKLGEFKKKWGGFLYPPYFDWGGSQMTIDTFKRDHGIPVVLAARKQDLPGQVARFADLLGQRRAMIRIGSALEYDLQNARFNPDARVEGRYEWTSDVHPDAADAGRYGLQAYVDHYRPPVVKIADTDPFESRMRQLESLAAEEPRGYFAGRIRGTA